jgi:iron complex transport system ATP-binding protein
MDKNSIHTVNLLFGYDNKPLSGISNISAKKGEIVAVIGKNGVGKSTFLKTLSGLIKPLAGSTFINCEEVSKINRKKIAKLISYVFTNRIDGNLDVLETVLLGRTPYLKWHGKTDDKDNEIAYKIMDKLRIGHLANKKINQISDGEQKKVMIARAIAQETPIIILDEPTAFLDIGNKIKTFELIKDMKDQNLTVIFSTHDLKGAANVADKFWLITEEHFDEVFVKDLNISLLEKIFNENTSKLEKYI